jgi:hypothetical protein
MGFYYFTGVLLGFNYDFTGTLMGFNGNYPLGI